MPQRLLVIGAGPKALAIAGKAQVLSELGFANVPQVVIIDKLEVAANWDGQHGFTDGRQNLGTPPEKDIGFPYRSGEWAELNNQVDDRMLRFSWHRFKVLGDSVEPLFTWVDRGRLQPTHGEWANYLRWVAGQLAYEWHQGEVKKIALTKNGKWKLTVVNSAGDSQSIEGDGVVISGPGAVDARTTISKVFNPVTFWPAVGTFQGEGLDVCVVGVGETAGAMVAALAKRLGVDSRVFVISPHGFIYSRGESLLENRVYSDPSNWEDIAAKHRKEFIRRTDRGVFSVAVQEEINASHVPVLCLPGRADLDKLRPSDHNGIRVEVSYEGASRQYEFDYIVDAASVNRRWFLSLMEDGLRESFEENLRDLERDYPVPVPNDKKLTDRIEEVIDFNLRVRSFSPNLHLPMLAAFRRGPGFPNLSCLGTLSDRILKAYARVPPKTPPKRKAKKPS